MATKDPGALLDRLLLEPTEVEWLEFKHNNSNPEKVGKIISACANAAMLKERDRAFIVWGIENNTKRRLGTTVYLNTLKVGAENFQNWICRMINPKLMMEFLDFEVDGLHFAIISIEPSYDKPVKFGEYEYIRIGENVKKLKEFPEHERALWLATGRRRFESATAAMHQSRDDIFSKLDTEIYYKLREENVPQNDDEILRRLTRLGCIYEDMESGYNITNLGAVLFAKDITAFPSVATKSVRVVKYSGVDKRSSEEETEGRMGYAVGFTGLFKFVVNRLPKKEVYSDGLRKNPTYSTIAIREIIVNALIHQDFSITGSGPLVEIYSDRVEVTNPGNSLIDLDRIIDERRSRNEKLASAMRELGICEERGGGIDKAIIDTEEKYLPAPEFIASKESMRVIIFGPREYSALSKADKLWSCFCHCVIRWLRRDYMSNTTLRERFSLPDEKYQAVSSIISMALKEGRIIPADETQGRRNARYIPYWAR